MLEGFFNLSERSESRPSQARSETTTLWHKRPSASDLGRALLYKELGEADARGGSRGNAA